MRVIAGKAKGIRLKTPRQIRGIRPLTDQAREALFNILGAGVVDGNFLDLFAGTGAVGIEALSRGAKLVFFVEMSRPAVALIRQNLELTGFTDRAEVYLMEVIRALNLFHARGAKFDMLYLGAPYESPALEKALGKLAEVNIINAGGVIIAEHRKQHALAENYGAMEKKRDARYGETILSFYKAGQ